MTRHLHLRLNEFIRSFRGKVLLAESKACGKTRRHGVPDQGSRMVGNTAQLGGRGEGGTWAAPGDSFPVWLEQASGSS